MDFRIDQCLPLLEQKYLFHFPKTVLPICASVCWDRWLVYLVCGCQSRRARLKKPHLRKLTHPEPYSDEILDFELCDEIFKDLGGETWIIVGHQADCSRQLLKSFLMVPISWYSHSWIIVSQCMGTGPDELLLMNRIQDTTSKIGPQKTMTSILFELTSLCWLCSMKQMLCCVGESCIAGNQASQWQIKMYWILSLSHIYLYIYYIYIYIILPVRTKILLASSLTITTVLSTS